MERKPWFIEIIWEMKPSWSMWRWSSTCGRFDEALDGIILSRLGWIIEGSIGIWTRDIDGPWTLVQEGEDHLSLKISISWLMMPLDFVYTYGFDDFVYTYGFDDYVYFLYFQHMYLSIWMFLTSVWSILCPKLLYINYQSRYRKLMKCGALYVLS